MTLKIVWSRFEEGSLFHSVVWAGESEFRNVVGIR
jgi:hypothetical protein